MMRLHSTASCLSAGIGLLTAAAMLSGCAGTAAESGTRASAVSSTTGSDCITGDIRDYTTLDDQNLILYGTGNRPYHVILATPAMNLESEFSIGIYDRDAAFGGLGRLCAYGGDAILIQGPLEERIPIRSIERIDDDDVEALKVRFGKSEADDVEVTVTEIPESDG